jgi:hypothetical protein
MYLSERQVRILPVNLVRGPSVGLHVEYDLNNLGPRTSNYGKSFAVDYDMVIKGDYGHNTTILQEL